MKRELETTFKIEELSPVHNSLSNIMSAKAHKLFMQVSANSA